MCFIFNADKYIEMTWSQNYILYIWMNDTLSSKISFGVGFTTAFVIEICTNILAKWKFGLLILVEVCDHSFFQALHLGFAVASVYSRFLKLVAGVVIADPFSVWSRHCLWLHFVRSLVTHGCAEIASLAVAVGVHCSRKSIKMALFQFAFYDRK